MISRNGLKKIHCPKTEHREKSALPENNPSAGMLLCEESQLCEQKCSKKINKSQNKYILTNTYKVSVCLNTGQTPDVRQRASVFRSKRWRSRVVAIRVLVSCAYTSHSLCLSCHFYVWDHCVEETIQVLKIMMVTPEKKGFHFQTHGSQIWLTYWTLACIQDRFYE